MRHPWRTLPLLACVLAALAHAAAKDSALIPTPQPQTNYQMWIMWHPEEGKTEHKTLDASDKLGAMKEIDACVQAHGTCSIALFKVDEQGLHWPVGFWEVPEDLEPGEKEP